MSSFDPISVPREQIPALIAVLLARLLEPENSAAPAAAPGDGDRLLTAEQAAERLGVTKDNLYRNAKTLPFVVRLGPGQLRFSAAGIDRYIKAKTLKRAV